jgi:hypothetical protein
MLQSIVSLTVLAVLATCCRRLAQHRFDRLPFGRAQVVRPRAGATFAYSARCRRSIMPASLRIAARSSTLRSLRTLPGQVCVSNASRAPQAFAGQARDPD